VEREAEETVTAPVEQRPGLHRRLYDWVLSWAESRWGTVGLFGLSFAESSFFPVPPDPLLMALALGKRTRSLFYALVCSLASVLGGVFGYLVGAFVWSQIEQFCYTYIPGFTRDVFDYVKGLYTDYDFWVVFTAGFTPIPYKVITVSAGVFGVSFPIFLIASAVSRSARFFLVAGLVYIFGEQIKGFIDRYFNMLSIIFVVLLILGFLVFKFVI
jgi:membrane protein YqaA with SNARE-associated domain